jgi:hypothetical protein
MSAPNNNNLQQKYEQKVSDPVKRQQNSPLPNDVIT